MTPGATPTSHIVLGLLAMLGQATPYDLEQTAPGASGHCRTTGSRQVGACRYLTEGQEPDGRRRKSYGFPTLAVRRWGIWLANPTPKLRDRGFWTEHAA
ncbi:MAG: hypothetical protein ACRDK2_13050 [Solirubrobacteraceae bacterium]